MTKLFLLVVCSLLLLAFSSSVILAATTASANSDEKTKKSSDKKNNNNNVVAVTNNEVNMSQRLVIPDSLRESVPEMVKPSDSASQENARKLLRKWAENVLSCVEEPISSPSSTRRKLPPICKQSKKKYLPCSAEVANAWNILGVVLTRNERIGIEGVSDSYIDKKQALREALLCDPRHARSWFAVHLLLVSSVSNPAELNTVRFELQSKAAGGGGGGATRYSVKDALVRAAELAPWHSSAYTKLASALTTNPSAPEERRFIKLNGKKFDKKALLLQALEYEGTRNANLWTQLGNSLLSAEQNAQQDGIPQQESVVVRVRIPPSSSSFSSSSNKSDNDNDDGGGDDSSVDAWGTIEADDGEEKKKNQIKYRTAIFTKLHCFIRALILDPSMRVNWFNVGVALAVNEGVTIPSMNNMVFNKRDCLVHALFFSGKVATSSSAAANEQALQQEKLFESELYAQLGDILGFDEKFKVKRKRQNQQQDQQEEADEQQEEEDGENNDHHLLPTLTKKQCYVESLNRNSKLQKVWMELGVVLEREQKKSSKNRVALATAPIQEGKFTHHYTALECFRQVVLLDSFLIMASQDRGGFGEDESSFLTGSSESQSENNLLSFTPDPRTARALYNLGVLIMSSSSSSSSSSSISLPPFEQTVELFGISFKPRQLFLESLSIQQRASEASTSPSASASRLSPFRCSPSAWLALGNLLGDEEVTDAAAPSSSSSSSSEDDDDNNNEAVAKNEDGEEKQKRKKKNKKKKKTTYSVFYEGMEYDRKNCYVKSVLCFENHFANFSQDKKGQHLPLEHPFLQQRESAKLSASSAWFNIGISVLQKNKDGTVSDSFSIENLVTKVKTVVTMKTAMMKSLELDPSNAEAWLYLGQLGLKTHEKAVFSPESGVNCKEKNNHSEDQEEEEEEGCGRDDCFRKYDELKPQAKKKSGEEEEAEGGKNSDL